jgi:hypothetical protein
MNSSDPPVSRFPSLLQVVVALGVIVILAVLALPQVPFDGIRGDILQTMNNMRQIHMATLSMANDGIESKNPKFGWPGDLAVAEKDPVLSLPAFVERLVEYDYIKRSDLGKNFAAPGVPVYPGKGPFESRYSAFKIYRVRENDAKNCLFAATRNFTMGKDLGPNAVPFGDKRFVIIRRGGDAVPFNNKQSARGHLGFLPGQTSEDEARNETADCILKM